MPSKWAQKLEQRRQQAFEKRLITYFHTPTANLQLPSSPNELYEEMENKVWFQANGADELLRFYNTRYKIDNGFSANINQFYRISRNSDIAIMHYNTPQMLTKSMVNLLFSNLPDITTKTGNQETDKKLNQLLDKIYKDNEYKTLLNRAAEIASYSGRVGFKLIMDQDVSEYPIIQLYPKESIKILTEYGRTSEIIFKDFYTKDGDSSRNYVLYSIYGKGYVKYKLYDEKFTITNQEADRQEVPLSTIPELADLKDQDFYYSDGSRVDKILAVVIDNKESRKIRLLWMYR